jgi:hypothetical protein
MQGENSPTFDLVILDDGERDGTQTVTVTATAAGWTPGPAEINAIDKAATPFAGGCTQGAGSVTTLLLAVAAVTFVIFVLGRRVATSASRASPATPARRGRS